jgi:hypothetical protein
VARRKSDAGSGADVLGTSSTSPVTRRAGGPVSTLAMCQSGLPLVRPPNPPLLSSPQSASCWEPGSPEHEPVTSRR